MSLEIRFDDSRRLQGQQPKDSGSRSLPYDSAALRQFVGIDLGCEPAPDETSVCKFRHLLEEHHPSHNFNLTTGSAVP